MSSLQPDLAFSVVIPVYRSEESIPPLLARLAELFEQLDGKAEAVFVVDGSPDASWLLLRRLLPNVQFSSQLLAHSRNFGSFAAIRTGLAHARGRYVAVMAADLQEPPALVLEFFRALASGEYEIAVGRRVRRADPWLSTVVSRAVWRLVRRVVDREIPLGGVDIFACTSTVASELVALQESHSSLIGLLYWLGFRRIEVPYERLRRVGGRSAWSFRRKLRYLLDSLFSFTDIPIMTLTVLGLVGAAVTSVVGLVVFVARVTGQIRLAGYAPVVLLIALSTFMLLFGMGVVGSYVWRTYENSKARPSAIVMSREAFTVSDER
jgi:polyisoprenyl-phosphate glycosyltransferase